MRNISIIIESKESFQNVIKNLKIQNSKLIDLILFQPNSNMCHAPNSEIIPSSYIILEKEETQEKAEMKYLLNHADITRES